MVNAGAEKLFGYAREDLIGRPVEMLVPARFRAAHPRVRSAYTEHPETRPMGKGRDLFALRKDGTEVPVEIGLNPIQTDEGPLIVSVITDITERKSAEESQVRLAAIVNSSDDAIIGKTLDGIIMSWNPGAEKIFGYSAAEAVGQPMLMLFPPERVDEEKEILTRISRGMSVDHFDTVRVHKDGKLIDVSITLSPISDGKGKIIGASKVARDVTERKRAEASLARQARLLNVSFDAILLWELEGPIIYWNEGAQEMYGFPPGEAIGRQSHDLLCTYHPQGVESFKIQLKQIGTWSGELHHRTRTGTQIIVESRMRLVREANGQQIVFETNRDITERKRNEEALRQSETFNREILDSLTAHIAVLDREGRIVLVNEAWRRFAAHDRHGLICDCVGENYLSVCSKAAECDGNEIAKAVFAGIRKVMDGTQNYFGLEYPCHSADEQRWFRLHVCPLTTGSSAVVTAHEDITERWHAEEAIRKLNAELEERVIERTAQLEAANKELEAFSYSVSHDLRSPLRTVDGFAQMALEDYAPQLPPEGVHCLKTICDGAQRMGALIDDLLTFSRLSRAPLNRRTVATDSLVRSILADLAVEREGRKMEFRIGELPPCSGDPALLKQVWVNLLSNACKYTKQRAVAEIEIGSKRENDETIYFVHDNGAGFDMRYVGKLFGVFQRLHRMEDYEGTGVGLAIVQRVIHRHGGRIWAEAAVDCGATFYFTLHEIKS